jgi:probable F420-dependent oxidoreductase
MRIGAVFPQHEIGNDPATIAHWARSVEGLGYTHILAFDHVLGAGVEDRPDWRGYTSANGFHEVFVLFGFLAAVTESVEFVTGVLVLPQRQTALVAKQAAEIDILSGGRLRLGVGVGWNYVEYEALGEDFKTRGRRADEQIGVLRELWSTDTVTVGSRWHTITNAGINPRPAGGNIPVWVGGNSDAALHRAGALGDGWFPQSAPTAAAQAMVERVRSFAEAAGRDPSTLGFEPRLSVSDVAPALQLKFAAEWQAIGATHLCVNTMDLGCRSADEHLAALEQTYDRISSAAGA